jgi:hypothetical protein
MRALRLLPALAVAAALLAPASASAQSPAPTLAVDTNYAFSGIVGYDFTVASGISPDGADGAAIDTAFDRHYAVGEGTRSGTDVAVVARRGNGDLDPTFAGDGTFALDVTTGEFDAATAMAVLPDHRLRILGFTDTGTGFDVVLVGLLPNGAPDPAFGGGDGVIVFPVDDLSTADDFPTRMAVDQAGRIAITGTTELLTDDTFVAVRNADGTPAAGFGDDGFVHLGGLASGDDAGTDVAWRGSGVVVLVQSGGDAALRALDAAGDDDDSFAGDGELPLEPNGAAANTGAGALTTYGNWIFVTGSVDVAGDLAAYLARVDSAGNGLQSRLFEMRGNVYPANQQVASRAYDLDVARGEPDTLVVAGSVTTDTGSDWGAIAFNGLDGDLAAMPSGDVVIPPVSKQGEAYGVAAGTNGAVALAGTLIDSTVTGGGTNDTSIGMARLLVDAEKQCDLGLSIAAPLELVLRGTAPSAVTLVARNGGLRACGGSVSVPAPYGMAPETLETGKLAPGQAVRLDATIGRPVPYPAEDTIAFTLTSPTDVAPGDNVARLHVAFSFCDLRLVATGAPRFIGTEGTRLFGFTVRNAGTETCRGTRIDVSGAAARVARGARYTVPAGQSVTDEFELRLRRRAARPGQRALIGFTAVDAAELLPADNAVLSAPRVVFPGDTRARRPTGNRRFSGTASNGRARGVRAPMLRLARVEIAVRKAAGKTCRWLSSSAGDLHKVPRSGCDDPVWIRAKGTRDWRLRLRRKLPAGRYTLFTRAITRNGVTEGSFRFADRNMLRFRLR